MNCLHFAVVWGFVCIIYTYGACPNDCVCEKQKPGGYGELVKCIGSNIVNFPTNIEDSTESIILSKTSVTNIPKDAFSNLPNLKTIYIDNNKKLKSLPAGLFNNLKELKLINIASNGLISIPDNFVNNLPNLTSIIFKNNDLVQFPSNAFRNLPKLDHFQINGNKLTSLPEDLFDDSFKALAYIDVDDNQLSSLPNDIFTPIKDSLETLSISGNNFRFLPMNAIRIFGNQFSEIIVRDNPTQCNCSVKEFVEWASENDYTDEVSCNRADKLFSEIKSNLANCEIPTTKPPTTAQIPTATPQPTKPKPTTTVEVTTTTGKLSTMKSSEPSTTREITSKTLEPSTSKVPFNPKLSTTKKHPLTTRMSSLTTDLPSSTRRQTAIASTPRKSTKESSTKAITTPKTIKTQTTESVVNPGTQDKGNIETQDTRNDNGKRKTIIIAISVAAVAIVVILSIILCLFHTGILSTRRFKKDKVVIYDAEGNILMTEKQDV